MHNIDGNALECNAIKANENQIKGLLTSSAQGDYVIVDSVTDVTLTDTWFDDLDDLIGEDGIHELVQPSEITGEYIGLPIVSIYI